MNDSRPKRSALDCPRRNTWFSHRNWILFNFASLHFQLVVDPRLPHQCGRQRRWEKSFLSFLFDLTSSRAEVEPEKRISINSSLNGLTMKMWWKQAEGTSWKDSKCGNCFHVHCLSVGRRWRVRGMENVKAHLGNQINYALMRLSSFFCELFFSSFYW